jgi:C-terminal processing protease CtpA/Prc
MLSYLLPRGAYATLTKSDKQFTLTSSGTTELSEPSVTLIDSQTYGEAELFAAALSEQQKTKLIGVKTAGCAMVQEYFAVTSTNARIKLSTGQLSLPLGGSWQGVGITPAQIVYSVVDENGEESQMKEALVALGAFTPTTTPTTTTTTTTTATTTTAADGETTETTVAE